MFGKSLRENFSQAEGLNFIHENIDVIKVMADSETGSWCGWALLS